MKNKKIAIVTPDLAGIVRNGGIGTACAELANLLVSHGISTTILFTQTPDTKDWKRQVRKGAIEWRSRGVEIEIAHSVKVKGDIFPNSPYILMSAKVNEWLTSKAFDRVFFMDWQGNGFFSLMARRNGTNHQQHGEFIVIAHSPTYWARTGNAEFEASPDSALLYYMERKSLELADRVVSPSKYMFRWVSENYSILPSKSKVLPNPISSINLNRDRYLPESVAFFGRLEYRKGLSQFCAAMDILNKRNAQPHTVYFIGKAAFFGAESSLSYLEKRSRAWRAKVRVLTSLGYEAAIKFLAAHRCLAVAPSVIDNSPFTVYECIHNNIPIISRDVGGTPELFLTEERSAFLVSDNPRDLAEKISNILKTPKWPTLSFDVASVRAEWVSLAMEPKVTPSEVILDERPLVSVCIVHYNRQELLRQALQSALDQTYPNIEIVVVDDGSDDLRKVEIIIKRFEQNERNIPIKYLRIQNSYVGAARNAAARSADGDYILFLDDDNVLDSQFVEKTVGSLISQGADICSTFAKVFSGTGYPNSKTKVIETYMPVGGGLAYAPYGNAFGDACSLFRRACFQSLGGFTERYGLGHEDFEIFALAAMRGAKMIVVPEALLWYRRQRRSMISTTPANANVTRSMMPVLANLDPALSELAYQFYSSVDPIRNPGCEKGPEPNAPAAIEQVVKQALLNNNLSFARELLPQTRMSKGRGMLAELIDSISRLEDREEPIPPSLLPVFDDQEEESVGGIIYRYLKLADEQIAKRMLLRWLGAEPKDPEPRLRVALQLAHEQLLEEAKVHYRQAMSLADHIYLMYRPDVQKAVLRGEFDSGLVHYRLHGQQEGSVWPHSKLFRQVASTLFDGCTG